MQGTRRTWAVVALTVFLVGYGTIVDSRVPAIGATLVGAWLVGRQVAFTAQLARVQTELTVSQRPARTRARTGESDQLTLLATKGELPESADDDVDAPPDSDEVHGPAVDITVTAGAPTAAVTDRPLSVQLGPSMTAATASAAVEWPVAGRHEFEPASVRVRDGTFAETLSMGDQPTVTVETQRVGSLHVGEGGDRVAVGVGTRDDGRRGRGLEPAALRKYTTGDAAASIDWKATARLSTPYVREYEAETDRRTVLVVDARQSLSTGGPGGSPLEHLTSVGLSVADDAHRHGDSLGLVVVGDDGIKTRIPTSSGADTDVRIRRTLLDLEPEASRSGASSAGRPGAGTPASETSAPGGMARRHVGTARAPTTGTSDAQSARVALDGTSAFDRSLRPFYADRTAYVERVADAPLFAAVDELLGREPGGVWPVILTDDTARAEVAETVSNARTRGDGTLVAIAPTVLYERDGLGDLDRAYERYVEFETFRRQLGRQTGVTALEVGPADRLEAVLETGGDRP